MPTNIWTYAGEAGKRLDATVRPFEGDGAFLRFASLEPDTWRWSVPLAELVPGSEEYPEEGQLVTLYRNGQRFFRGTALRPDQSDFRVGIEVAGPWKWLEEELLTTAVTLDAASGGGEGVRTSIGFPAQNMSTNLNTLIDRCIAMGAPIVKGTIPTTFSVLPITLKNGSCAEAIVELTRLIGDMMVWFDYSGSGNPVLKITRRKSGLAAGSAEVVTLDAGEFIPGQFKLVPQDEFRVSQVRVPFLDRGASGARRYQEQKSGTPEDGHVMILTASGQELDTFLPDENLDSYQMQTVATSGTALRDWLMAKDSGIAAAAQVAGVAPALLPLVMGPGTLNYATNSNTLPTTNKAIPIAAMQFLNESGQPVSTAGKNMLVSSTLPEWLKSQYTVEEVTVSGPLYYEFKESTYVSGSLTGTFQLPAWWYSVQWSVTDSAGFKGNNNQNYSGYELFIRNVEVRAYLVNASSPSPTTIYKQPDYTFIAPPSGFAAGLLGARDWTPYKGTCGWADQDAGAARYSGKLVNVTGADPAFETMKAMVASEELDLGSGRTRLNLGPPARLNFDTLLEAVRFNPNEQIQYL